jgi:hypothetical protein
MAEKMAVQRVDRMVVLSADSTAVHWVVRWAEWWVVWLVALTAETTAVRTAD